jgi:FkbM family methyltransferase
MKAVAPLLTEKRIRFIDRALRSVAHFGVGAGVRIVAQLYPSRDVDVRVPGLRDAIHLRGGSSDAAVFAKVFLDRDYASLPVRASPRFIVDAGANTGCSAVFLTVAFPDAEILAIEADPGNYAELVRNTAAYPQISTLHAAVWGRHAALVLDNHEWGEMAVQAQEAADDVAGVVPAMTMRDVLERSPYGAIDILKMDVECAEREIFGGPDTEWLDRVELITIELHDWIAPGCADAFYHALTPHRFIQLVSGENVVVVKSPVGR